MKTIKYSELSEVGKLYLQGLLQMIYSDYLIMLNALKELDPLIVFNRKTASVGLVRPLEFNSLYRDKLLVAHSN